MKTEIRLFDPKDEIQLIDLWVECGLVVPWNDPKKDIRRKFLNSPQLFFVGEADGEIIASCMAGYDGHRGWVYYLAVKTKYQNQGIASLILSHSENALLKVGCPKIDLMVRNTNSEIISFYHKVGYKNDPVVVLSKRLQNDD
jgi:ribosomal protein S18 acetylase RimI-like enzyme